MNFRPWRGLALVGFSALYSMDSAAERARACCIVACSASLTSKRKPMTTGNTTPETKSGLPLEGITVLDLTLARAGPTCVRHLADWGANVIRIEPPTTGEDEVGRRDGFDFQNLHRNKRAMNLNLKSE